MSARELSEAEAAEVERFGLDRPERAAAGQGGSNHALSDALGTMTPPMLHDIFEGGNR